MLVCRRNLARPKSTERVEKRHSRIRDDHLPAGDDAAEVNERLGAATTAAGAERGAAAHLVERGRPQDGGGADTVAGVWVRGSERWLTRLLPPAARAGSPAASFRRGARWLASSAEW